jgi:hypothetical protein
MPTIEAVVRTDRASRYLVQFCRHATAMGGAGGHRHGRHRDGDPVPPGMQAHAECSDTHGVVTFTPGGRCTLEADADTLRVRIDATDDEALQRIRDIVTGDLARFNHRDPLTLTWRP